MGYREVCDGAEEDGVKVATSCDELNGHVLTNSGKAKPRKDTFNVVSRGWHTFI